MLQCVFLFVLVVPAYGNIICCAPDQFEASEGLMTGSVSDEGDSAATYGTIGLSYDAKRLALFENLRLTVTNMSHNYKILILYKQNVQYIMEDNLCTHSKPERPWTPYCIPSNATAVPSYYIGLQNQSLTVQEYTFRVDRNTISIAFTGNDCMPVIYKSYGEINGQSVMTFTGFQNLTAGIKDPHIFDVPNICKHAQPITETFRRTRRSLFAMINRR